VNSPHQTGKTRRIAISIDLDWGFKHHTEVFAGCQRYADEAGWQSSLHPAPERVILAHGGKNPGFDGIIARATPALAKAAARAGIPLVNVWLNSPARHLPSTFVDYEAAGAMAAEHLLGRGFRHFGFLGYLREIDSRLLLNGYQSVIQQAGYDCNIHRFPRTSIMGNAPGWDTFVSGLEKWIDTWQTPIGIFVTHDLHCRHLIDVSRSKGLHVSQNVAIVGTSNETAICDSPSPALTSIDMGYGQVGYRAAAMLERLMDGAPPPSDPELVPPAELIPRQSTDSFAADDPLVARAMRYILEHGHERIQVKDVAAAVATTRRTLERRFRESLGRSIASEITRLRIERAKRIMTETDAPMKEVAKDSGFRNADHFYKVFARVEGIPPTQYRADHQRAFPKRV
jgi:LacI family transcriptional regulator